MLDRLVAAALLLLLSPALLVISLWILLDDGRPVLLAQERVGKNGRRFRMLKFRTMVQNALELARELTDDPYGVVPDDPRITERAGCCGARASTSCRSSERPRRRDEPRRPAAGPVEQAANYTERDRRPAGRQPGITGWAQVNGREEIRWPERIDAGPLVHRALVARARR